MGSRSRYRRISQLIFLAVFIVLLYYTRYPLHFAQTTIFVRSSPLLMIVTLLTTHIILPQFAAAILLLAATLLLGRLFCGWICPLGALLDLVPVNRFKRMLKYHRNIPSFKYYFLIFVLVSSILGVNLLIISDPIVIFTRSLVFISQMTLPLMLILIIGLAIVAGERFWCRSVCPLGALLGFFSFARVVNIRIEENCVQCGVCSKVCPMDAIDGVTVKKLECTLCLLCVDKCPQRAATLSTKETGGKREKEEVEGKPVFSEGRRTFLRAGIAAGAALLLSPLLGRIPSVQQFIRPPGALREEKFLDVCTRCGECMRVCPSQGLRPVMLEGSLSTFYTPKLVPRKGRCELCMLCWQVCPTGALIEVDPKRMKIGTATVNRDLCIVWRDEKVCLICQEVCPFQAIEVVGGGGRGRGSVGGQERGGPQVSRTVCAGCGACENACPLEVPAITVASDGEIRY